MKIIEHKLLERTAEKAVVETVVTEGEIFGYVQTAPTKRDLPREDEQRKCWTNCSRRPERSRKTRR